MLKIRKLADRTGDPFPDGTWPAAGIKLEHDEPPATLTVPMDWAIRAQSEGWVTLGGATVVHRPGGPADDQWRVTHTFTHAETLTIHTVDGDVTYRVTHQPDKYHADDNEAQVTPEAYEAGQTRVDHFYRLELED